MTRHVKRGAKIWIRVFPDKPITKKPLEVRQGKGKGNVEYWVCPIKPGKILYEMEGVDEDLAKEAFKLASSENANIYNFYKESLMAKESLLDRLRSKPTEAPDEEGKLRKELMELRIQHSSGQLKETHKIREIRRSIAQLKTLDNEKKLPEKDDG